MSGALRQVSREQFFAPIFSRRLDVHPTIVSGYPYTSEWKFHRQIGEPLFGKTVKRIEGGVVVTDYFITEEEG